MKLTMLGTGHAVVTECYNTCFVIEDGENYFMVDGGGGGTLLSQLKRAGLKWSDMRHIFVTHQHIDHLLGIIWMLRMICSAMNHGNYDGQAHIYAHDEVIALLRDMGKKLLLDKESRYIDDKLHLVPLNDKDEKTIIGRQFTFFDIGSTKTKQFGFSIEIGNGKKLTCCGDEPCSLREEPYAKNSEWLLHEAFCLYSEKDIFKPYEKHHSTVKDACELAERLGVKNLLLYHTEDTDLPHRKERYRAEGKPYFSGNLFIPDDLETVRLT